MSLLTSVLSHGRTAWNNCTNQCFLHLFVALSATRQNGATSFGLWKSKVYKGWLSLVVIVKMLPRYSGNDT